jgi:hypothetical protein
VVLFDFKANKKVVVGEEMRSRIATMEQDKI